MALFHCGFSETVCFDISSFAKDVGVNRPDAPTYAQVHDHVAYRRKPLALAHSTIASHLNEIRKRCTIDMFVQIVEQLGLFAGEKDSATCDVSLDCRAL